jgi:hypothetical protein
MVFDDNWTPGDPGIHWVIAGGESQGGARPAPSFWFRSVRDQALAAGAAFLFKQWGEWLPSDQVQYLPADVRDRALARVVEAHGEAHIRYGKGLAGRLLDGQEWTQFPVPVRR